MKLGLLFLKTCLSQCQSHCKTSKVKLETDLREVIEPAIKDIDKLYLDWEDVKIDKPYKAGVNLSSQVEVESDPMIDITIGEEDEGESLDEEEEF